MRQLQEHQSHCNSRTGQNCRTLKEISDKYVKNSIKKKPKERSQMKIVGIPMVGQFVENL